MSSALTFTFLFSVLQLMEMVNYVSKARALSPSPLSRNVLVLGFSIHPTFLCRLPCDSIRCLFSIPSSSSVFCQAGLGLGGEHACFLGSAVAWESSCLQFLNLRSEMINCDCMSLSTLSFDSSSVLDNDLGPRGCAQLAWALYFNPHVTAVDISSECKEMQDFASARVTMSHYLDVLTVQRIVWVLKD